MAESVSHGRDDRHLDDCARNRYAPHLPEVPHVVVQSDAEHQQNHAELRQLMDGGEIASETGGERTQRDPCDEVPDDGRQADSSGDESANERVAQGDGEVDQEWEFVHGLRQNIPSRNQNAVGHRLIPVRASAPGE